jgi:hypothetical protein
MTTTATPTAGEDAPAFEPTFGERVMALPPKKQAIIVALLDVMLINQARDRAARKEVRS